MDKKTEGKEKRFLLHCALEISMTQLVALDLLQLVSLRQNK
jgi:hypothetical protein